MADELATLRAEAESLGVHVDGRWGAERLRSEIANAQSEPADELDDEPADELDDEPADELDDEPADELDDEPADEPADELDDRPAEVEPEAMPQPAESALEAPTPLIRAGGHIDYGDGRGWVVEEL